MSTKEIYLLHEIKVTIYLAFLHACACRCMLACMFRRMHTCVHMRVCVHMCVCVHMRKYAQGVRMHVCACVHPCVHACACMQVCACGFVHVCMHEFVCVCICIVVLSW